MTNVILLLIMKQKYYNILYFFPDHSMKPIESQRLVQLRGDMKQEEFASKIGMNRVNLSNIENGSQALSIKTAKMIKEHFNVSLDWLYGYTDQNIALEKPSGSPDSVSIVENLTRSLEDCKKDKEFLQGLLDKLSK